MVALAESMSEAESDRMARRLLGLRPDFKRFYYDWILSLEAGEATAALSSERPSGGTYRDVASTDGAAAYDRVADLFQNVNFEDCRRFVLVGAGELPITALHVHDRTEVPRIECLDTRPEVSDRIHAFSRWLGTDRLHANCHNGGQHDYSDADIVYVANMVWPKGAVIARILETAPANVQIILRDPYSFGMLWAEEGAASLDPCLEVATYGRGSRFLSRDLFLRRRGTLPGARG